MANRPASAPSEPSEYSLTYTLGRRDLWRAYWLKWTRERARLYLKWSLLLTLALAVQLVLTSPSMRLIPILLAVPPIFVGFLTCTTVLVSQLMYTRGTRSLHLDRSGWRVSLGEETAEKYWLDVYSVMDAGGFLLITGRDGNFLSIPWSAFADEQQRRECVEACVLWHRTANGG